MQLRVAVHLHILDLLSLPLPPASLSFEQFNTSHKHAQLRMLSRSYGCYELSHFVLFLLFLALFEI